MSDVSAGYVRPDFQNGFQANDYQHIAHIYFPVLHTYPPEFVYFDDRTQTFITGNPPRYRPAQLPNNQPSSIKPRHTSYTHLSNCATLTMADHNVITDALAGGAGGESDIDDLELDALLASEPAPQGGTEVSSLR